MFLRGFQKAFFVKKISYVGNFYTVLISIKKGRIKKLVKKDSSEMDRFGVIELVVGSSEQNNKKKPKLTEQGFFVNLFSSRHFQNVWNSERNFGYYLAIFDNFDWHHLHHRTLAYHYKQDRTKISIRKQYTH